MARSDQKDMEPEEVLFLLRKIKMSFADVDRAYGLKRGIAHHAARRAHLQGELALAEALGLSPRQMWPSRFDPSSGERYKPQPKNNHKPKRTLSHRQKRNANSTCGQSGEAA